MAAMYYPLFLPYLLSAHISEIAGHINKCFRCNVRLLDLDDIVANSIKHFHYGNPHFAPGMHVGSPINYRALSSSLFVVACLQRCSSTSWPTFFHWFKKHSSDLQTSLCQWTLSLGANLIHCCDLVFGLNADWAPLLSE